MTNLYSEDGDVGRMPELQGPALLQFDSGVFCEDDFDGLFSFGQG